MRFTPENLVGFDRPRLRWLWLFGLAAVAFLSLHPKTTPPPGGVGELGYDKIIHALTYAGLTIGPSLAWARRRTALALGALILFWGAGLEIAQGYIPNREASPGDLVANIAGVVIGLTVSWWAWRLIGGSAPKPRPGEQAPPDPHSSERG